MKLFQIEEPDSGLGEDGLPGAAVGIDLSGAAAVVAFSVGGNAVELNDREEFAKVLPAAAASRTAAEWQALFEAVRRRAERLLARPVTHAVVVVAGPRPAEDTLSLRAGAAAAGIEPLRLVDANEFGAADAPVLAAARLAEDLMPRPGTESLALPYFR
jgi:hypothetical protein